MNDKVTAYFKNGVLYKIRPFRFKKLYDDRKRAYEARYIVSDGQKYDLKDIESIKSIVAPKYTVDAPIGVTGYIEYVLGKHVPSGNDELDIEILITYTQLLKKSYWSYSAKEYFRLPKKFYEIGDFDNGDRFLEQLKEFVPHIFDYNPLPKINLRDFVEQNRKVYKGDLIEIKASYTRCEKCAIYASRVYSVNGEDARFPKCPEWIVEKGNVCDKGCGSAIFPFFYFPGQTIQAYETYGGIILKDAISYSNRPFIDMRDADEVERFHKLQAQREDEMIKSTYYMQNYRNFCYGKINNPKKTPKSFSAYMRKLNKEGRYY